jgi:dephospho-CoA kinase
VAEPGPFVIGLTGSIAMGKTETARLFAAEGVPVFDADGAIHALYSGAAAPVIEREFPGTVRDGVVDRAALSARITDDAAALARLEALIHPLVRAARARFLETHAGAPIVLLDIPLLLETATPVDAVVVASAPAHVQRARVLVRPGMSEAKFAALVSRQMSDAQKRQQADYVVTTDKGLDDARDQVRMILADIRGKLRNA